MDHMDLMEFENKKFENMCHMQHPIKHLWDDMDPKSPKSMPDLYDALESMILNQKRVND